MKFLSHLRDVGWALILPAVLLLAWEVGSSLSLFPSVLLPPPGQVGATFLDMASSGQLGDALEITLQRVLFGFAIGSVVGFAVGAAMALSPAVDRYAGPLFHGFRQVPIYGWMPLLILWLGVGEPFKIAFIALGAFYPLVLNTYEGIRSVPVQQLEVARVFEYGPFRLFRRVILPGALPSIFTGLRFALGHCWTLVIAAEFLASTTGIGYVMAWSRTLMQSDAVIVGIISVGTIGFLMDFSLRQIERRVLAWRRNTVLP